MDDRTRFELGADRPLLSRPELGLDEHHDEQRAADHDEPVIGVHLGRQCAKSLAACEQAHSPARFIFAITANVPSPPRIPQYPSWAVTEAWPPGEAELAAAQVRLAGAARSAPPWELAPVDVGMIAGGCFLAFGRGPGGPGAAGDRGWAAAVSWPTPQVTPGEEKSRRADSALKGSGPGLPRLASDVAEQSVVAGTAPASYKPGFLALREGPLLAEAVCSLARLPEVLLVDATGHDHPRGAGLAVHLGAILNLPTVGVTHRPLLAYGERPMLERGSTSPLSIQGSVVAYWVCTRTSARPVVAHAGWRTSPETAAALVLACSSEAARTPIPLVEARRAAREARAVAEGRVNPG